MTRLIREMSPDQPVERAATLEDVRAQVLSPERLNAFVFSGFAGVALLIAVVGVAGVLAFSVSARTREFGVRLAVGALARSPAGARAGRGHLHRGDRDRRRARRVATRCRALAVRFVENTQLPGGVPVVGAAAVLVAAAVVASLTPAARASRVDVVQALRSE